MNEKPKHVRVIKSHSATYPDPIQVKFREKVRVGGTDEEWSGWVWCTNRKGKGGWVPQSYLKMTGKTGTLRRNFNAMELTVTAGEKLAVQQEVSGWLLCKNESGQRGWVPAKNVEKI